MPPTPGRLLQVQTGFCNPPPWKGKKKLILNDSLSSFRVGRGGHCLCYPEVPATPSTGAVSNGQCQVPMALEGKEKEFHWLPAIMLRVPTNHILKGSRADLAKQVVGVGGRDEAWIQPLTLIPANHFLLLLSRGIKKGVLPRVLGRCQPESWQELGRRSQRHRESEPRHGKWNLETGMRGDCSFRRQSGCKRLEARLSSLEVHHDSQS